LEEYLESLGILQNNQGRSQAAPLAATGSELGAATGRSHNVAAECLGILNILELPQPECANPLS